MLEKLFQLNYKLGFKHFLGSGELHFIYTVTTDLQAKDINGYSGIQKHVEHDENIKHFQKTA